MTNKIKQAAKTNNTDINNKESCQPIKFDLDIDKYLMQQLVQKSDIANLSYIQKMNSQCEDIEPPQMSQLQLQGSIGMNQQQLLHQHQNNITKAVFISKNSIDTQYFKQLQRYFLKDQILIFNTETNNSIYTKHTTSPNVSQKSINSPTSKCPNLRYFDVVLYSESEKQQLSKLLNKNQLHNNFQNTTILTDFKYLQFIVQLNYSECFLFNNYFSHNYVIQCVSSKQSKQYYDIFQDMDYLPIQNQQYQLQQFFYEYIMIKCIKIIHQYINQNNQQNQLNMSKFDEISEYLNTTVSSNQQFNANITKTHFKLQPSKMQQQISQSEEVKQFRTALQQLMFMLQFYIATEQDFPLNIKCKYVNKISLQTNILKFVNYQQFSQYLDFKNYFGENQLIDIIKEDFEINYQNYLSQQSEDLLKKQGSFLLQHFTQICNNQQLQMYYFDLNQEGQICDFNDQFIRFEDNKATYVGSDLSKLLIGLERNKEQDNVFIKKQCQTFNNKILEINLLLTADQSGIMCYQHNLINVTLVELTKYHQCEQKIDDLLMELQKTTQLDQNTIQQQIETEINYFIKTLMQNYTLHTQMQKNFQTLKLLLDINYYNKKLVIKLHQINNDFLVYTNIEYQYFIDVMSFILLNQKQEQFQNIGQYTYCQKDDQLNKSCGLVVE